jgi:T5orf172 domain
MTQIIYILTNEAMPGLIKIGKTSTDLKERVKELSRATGVPFPFEVYYACEVENCDLVERGIHEAFGDERVNPKREFFRKNPERVVAFLKLLSKREIKIEDSSVVDSTEELTALTKEQNRKRSNFRFSLAQVPIGSIIYFIRNPEITATVLDDRTISFENTITTVSAAANKLLGHNYGVQGTIYWTYEGETLDERRQRIEENN